MNSQPKKYAMAPLEVHRAKGEKGSADGLDMPSHCRRRHRWRNKPDKGERLSKATHSALGDINAFSMATLNCTAAEASATAAFCLLLGRPLGKKFGRSNGLNEAWHT